MIKTIIKRNGQKEAFDSSKVNSWAAWALKGYEDRVEWSSVVSNACANLGEEISSKELQEAIINACLMREDWPHNVMAGRLHIANLRKDLYDNKVPSVRELFTHLASVGLMRYFDYSDKEWETIEKTINHDLDFNMAHFQVDYCVHKYAIQNRAENKIYETPQFIFMRMALEIAEHETHHHRMVTMKDYYNNFSATRLSSPSPNYINFGTNHRGTASCCLFVADDTAESIGAANHIAYTMTHMSAGIGGLLNIRSALDPVRNGKIRHLGKYHYYNAIAALVKSNLQAGRGGACNLYYSAFDPENQMLTMLQNPRTPTGRQIRSIHFTMQSNLFFAKKAKNDEEVFLFNCYTAPDLSEAFYNGDQERFETLYNQYEQNPDFKKTYVNARDIIINRGRQAYEVASLYHMFVDEANRHTPHKDKIYSSNLCVEILQPTIPYPSVEWLLKDEDHGQGEVSTCSLSAINIAHDVSDEEYERTAYLAVKLADRSVDMGDYKLPHVNFTSRMRRNVGVGILGLATHMARKNLRWDTPEGLKEIDRVMERHAYFVAKASLRLGKELGNAPWMHKTKWPDGWLWIDTYKKMVDKLVEPEFRYDWETLRKEIIENKGIRNSSLIALMPTESSSKPMGVPNGPYPIQDLFKKKTDANSAIDWCAIDNDILGDRYQIAWTISPIDMVKVYAVMQKWVDQSISADFYKDRRFDVNISEKEILEHYLTMAMYGVKTMYYQRSWTINQEVHDEHGNIALSDASPTYEVGCVGGTCSL